jgi:hypothetical protein
MPSPPSIISSAPVTFFIIIEMAADQAAKFGGRFLVD